MLPKVFVSDLVEDTHIQTTFLVTAKSLRQTRTGSEYLCVTLTDRTGRVEARAWDNARALASRVDEEDFVVLHGLVQRYQETLQIKLLDLERLDESDVQLADYLPTSRWAPEALFAQLKDVVLTEVEDPAMRRFFRALFGREELMALFKAAPAAMRNHHDYLGGLLEHALSMVRLSTSITRHYSLYYPGMINADLVLAGCVLHDMGKCQELVWRRRFGYSDQGKLVGHIVRGVELINETVTRMAPAPPEELVLQLKHLVVSHHGRLEYGSPIEPRTPEAMLLHQIDMIDSRMNMLWKAHQQLDPPPYPRGAWATRVHPFNHDVFFGAGPAPDVIRQDLDMLGGPGHLTIPRGLPPRKDATASTTRSHAPSPRPAIVEPPALPPQAHNPPMPRLQREPPVGTTPATSAPAPSRHDQHGASGADRHEEARPDDPNLNLFGD